MLSNPIFAFLNSLAWCYLYLLCRFGGVRRRLPAIAVCGLLMIGLAIYYLVITIVYSKNSSKTSFLVKEIKESHCVLSDELGNECTLIYSEVKRVHIRKKKVIICGKKTYLEINTTKLNEELRNYLTMKLKSRGIARQMFWRYPFLMLVCISTLIGGMSVLYSATPYNGELSWYLRDLENKRTVLLADEHKNLYETGIEGMLEDIRNKIDLPQTLTLFNSFNLHFAPDGTIETVDTMLCGYDEQKQFVNSYIITYNRKKSSKITIYLNKNMEKLYHEEENIQPLIDGVSAIDIPQVIENWNQTEYGILYYGVRQWGWGADNVFIINEQKETWPSKGGKGHSISIFCPNDEQIAPVRFLYKKAAISL